LIADPAAPTTTLTLQPGDPDTATVTFTVEDSNGCAAGDALTITRRTAPMAAIADPGVACHAPAASEAIVGVAASASGAAPFTWSWTSSSGTIAGNDVATLRVPSQPEAQAVEVQARVTDAFGCETVATRTVIVAPWAAADAGADSTGCVAPGTAVVPLDASATSGPPSRTLRWSADAGTIVDPSAALTELRVDVADLTRVVRVTLEAREPTGACGSTDSVVITLRPVPLADPGGPYSVLAGGGPTDEIPLDGSGSSGEGPLSHAWRTTLGTFLDTGTTTSALPAPVLSVPAAPMTQRGQVCLTVTAGNGCASAEGCRNVAVLLMPVNPPLDVGPSLRLRKEPGAVRLSWQDAGSDATHDEPLEYEIWTSATACGPHAVAARVPRTAGIHEWLDGASGALRHYVIVSSNDGGASSPPAPDGTNCR
jgi:hypothetical protein